ncbi:hypothetical protein LEN26_008958 [Aphanomyces euteiches]|nr:hypothetical protein LEN26_008958 [Aphanomyces euteiches]
MSSSPEWSKEKTPLVQTTTTAVKPPHRLARFPIAVAAVIALALGGGFVYLTRRHASRKLPTGGVTGGDSFCDTTNHEFGYIKLPHKVNDNYFYSFFESRNKPDTDPLLLWLEGGPGSSSTWAMLNVNGPCKIADDLSGTLPNPYSWTNNASVIWLDQPTGVGFSYGDAKDADSNEVDVGRNIYGFLQGWLKNHPKFQNHSFFITGQSYGGHYVPAAANYIVNQQKNPLPNGTIHINLVGIAIGNGLTDSVIQLPKIIDMVDSVREEYNITLVNPDQFKQMQVDANVLAGLVEKCQAPNETQSCLDTVDVWSNKLLTPMITNPDRNPYDIRKLCSGPTCLDDGMTKTETFLNQDNIQKALGVHKKYTWNNITVANAYGADIGKSTAPLVPDILEAGVRVLLYVGDADLMCDWKGNDAWAKKLQWSGHDAYNNASVVPLQVDGKQAGEVRSSGRFSFVRVFDSGHGVPETQPIVALTLLNRFVRNASLAKDEQVAQEENDESTN